MAANELINYLEFGNIKNSVNYPDVEMPRSDGQRLVILHKNIPNMISHISSAFSSRNINIENMPVSYTHLFDVKSVTMLGGAEINVVTLLIFVCAFVLCRTRKVSPILIIFACGAVGAVLL